MGQVAGKLGRLLCGAAALLALGCSSDDDGEVIGPATTGPIEAATETWSWVDVSGANCGDGSPTGISVNWSSTSGKLLVFLEDGGVCYSKSGCLGDDPDTANFDGYGRAEFDEWDARWGGSSGVFDRTDPNNPYRDYNYVFVPYCTGDVHIGSNVIDGLHFVGQDNVKADLARLVATFPNTEAVTVAGSSAGGFGALYNYHLFADAFPGATVTLIDDSGPFFPLSATPQLGALVEFYSLAKTIAPGCDVCIDKSNPDVGGLQNLVPHYAQTYPDARLAFISSRRDKTISGFYSIEQDAFEGFLDAVLANEYAQNPNFRSYVLESEGHVWLVGKPGSEGAADHPGGKLSDVQSGGVGLDAFLQKQLDGAGDWADVAPATN